MQKRLKVWPWALKWPSPVSSFSRAQKSVPLWNNSHTDMQVPSPSACSIILTLCINLQHHYISSHQVFFSSGFHLLNFHHFIYNIEPLNTWVYSWSSSIFFLQEIDPFSAQGFILTHLPLLLTQLRSSPRFSSCSSSITSYTASILSLYSGVLLLFHPF